MKQNNNITKYYLLSELEKTSKGIAQNLVNKHTVW